MINRGTAYSELPGPDRDANLREAIYCYRQAILVFEDHGSVHLVEIANLGLDLVRRLMSNPTN